jgi:ComF family protein
VTLNKLLAWVYPARCPLCGARNRDTTGLCSGCLAKLPRHDLACPRCASPAGDGSNPCGRCQRNPPAFHAALAPFSYRAPLDRLIVDLKFHHGLHLSRTLGRLLADELEIRQPDLPEAIVPIPLHASRLRERGYNQALEIAREVGTVLSLPVDFRSLVRTRATTAQTELPLAEREKNVRGAFACPHPLGWGHVALLDDVMTTGATVNEAAQSLIRAGVERVSVWAVARA